MTRDEALALYHPIQRVARRQPVRFHASRERARAMGRWEDRFAGGRRIGRDAQRYSHIQAERARTASVREGGAYLSICECRSPSDPSLLFPYHGGPSTSRLAFLSLTRRSPGHGARWSLEKTSDLRGDPPTVKVSRLRRHALVIDKAAVKGPGVKGDVVTQRSEGGVRIGIAPCEIAQRFAVHYDIEVDRFAFPLAERATA